MRIDSLVYEVSYRSLAPLPVSTTNINLHALLAELASHQRNQPLMLTRQLAKDSVRKSRSLDCLPMIVFTANLVLARIGSLSRLGAQLLWLPNKRKINTSVCLFKGATA
ncbi:hypothetical protein ASC90_26285 [Rhizobium sp. Root1220]|nr:hypothetical protein ASC90_26285 [Rhizobium sp. Root1220]